MRKTIVSAASGGFSEDASEQWLELEQMARVELSSEDIAHPFEHALAAGEGKGWRAGKTGPQTISLVFDRPQRIRRIRLCFREESKTRSQEFALFASSGPGPARELVRQQWSFSPAGSTTEIEDYPVQLTEVSRLDLQIDPGRHDQAATATLERLQIA